MIIFKCLIIVLTLFILPELLGLLILKFWKKEKNNVILALILGYIIEFAIAQLITVPLIFCNCTYKTLLIIYTILLLLLGILSLILNFKNFKEMFKCVCEEIKKLPKILTIICGILVILQIYMYIGNYIHTDNDDAYYVGTATTSIATNTIFKFSPTTGGLEGEQNILRYRLGPFPIYYAFISSWTNIHPAIIAHAVLPIFLILIVYSIYILVGYELFNKDLKAIMMFVLLLNFINIFGNYSVRTTFSFLLLRIWQGKAILNNIIMPLLLLLFLKAEKENFSIISCISIFITVLAGVFTTTMGTVFPPIIIGILALIFGIYNKNIKSIFKSFLCCIPSIVYGILYFVL